MSVNYKDFIHPLDESARNKLEDLPGFQKLMEWYLKIGTERMIHGTYTANYIRLSPTQLPELYNRLPRICEQFGIEEPEFFLSMNPYPNAWTVGDHKTFLTITSGLVEFLNDDELDAVIAHECGHIRCRHGLYHTVGYYLFGLLVASIPLARTLSMPIAEALLYWQRRSELSADRAASLLQDDSSAISHALLRLAGGPSSITEKLNIEEYAKQAEDYTEIRKNRWDRILQNLSIMGTSHPFMSVRFSELSKWEKSEEFRSIRQKIKSDVINISCPKCGRIIVSNHNFCTYCGEKIK